MKNYISEGDSMVFTAGEAITAGQMILVTGVVGVAVDNVANGETGVLATKGVFDVLKEGSDAPSQGQILYYNATNKSATVTASSNKVIGYAWTAAGASDITVHVRLSI